MDLPSMSRVTKLSIDALREKARSTPVFAPGLDNLAQTGAVLETWDDRQSLAGQLTATLAASSPLTSATALAANAAAAPKPRSSRVAYVTSLSAPAEPGFDRHRLVRLWPRAWADHLAARGDLRREALLADWAERGWPCVVRRPVPGEVGRIPLGLPLPPSHGRRRLMLSVERRDIESDAPLPRLAECRSTAPDAWRPTIDAILDVAERRGTDVRCFGSLAWSALTGLAYVSAASDLDLLLAPPDMRDAVALATAMAVVEASAPMRLDGEIVRADGAATNWREILAGADDLLVKSRDGVVLWNRDRFLGSAP